MFRPATGWLFCCTRALAVLLGLLVFCGTTYGADAANGLARTVELVTSDNSDNTKDIVKEFLTKFPQARVSSHSAPHKASDRSVIYVAIGPAALRGLISQRVQGVVVGTFTSSPVHHGIVSAKSDANTGPITAVYAEPAPAVQLHLAVNAFSPEVKVGVLLSERTKFLEPVLKAAAQRAGVRIDLAYVGPSEELGEALRDLSGVKVILAVPDGDIYNSVTIRSILIRTYRRDQLLIGFSPAMVKAGALISAYSGVGDMVAHVAEVVAGIESTGRIPEPQFPRYYSVVINEAVARSQNVVIDDDLKRLSSKLDRP